jgi:rSAM/selenodomain-associated transferase 1
MSNSNMRTVVALFVRVPIPGRVKTRLASNLGINGACELYRAMVADILSNIMDRGFPIYLFHDGKYSTELPVEWIQASSKVMAQSGDSIGDRMAVAFEHCFAENIEQVVLVGSDIPGLDYEIIVTASAALDIQDVAIAPAADGGYCLIALKQKIYKPQIFEDVPWSTDQVLRATLEKCEEYRLNVELLETLQDIDTIDDLKAYCRNPSKLAVFTNSYLKRLHLCKC